MTKLLNKYGKTACLVLGFYWIALCIGTHVPSSVLPKFNFADKILHFGAFAGLAFLLSWAVIARRGASVRTYGLILLVCLVYGIFDELLQIPIPGRKGEILDFVADAIGACVGIGFHVLLMKKLPDTSDTVEAKSA